MKSIDICPGVVLMVNCGRCDVLLCVALLCLVGLCRFNTSLALVVHFNYIYIARNQNVKRVGRGRNEFGRDCCAESDSCTVTVCKACWSLH